MSQQVHGRFPTLNNVGPMSFTVNDVEPKYENDRVPAGISVLIVATFVCVYGQWRYTIDLPEHMLMFGISTKASVSGVSRRTHVRTCVHIVLEIIIN